jgi:hypothetical protein
MSFAEGRSISAACLAAILLAAAAAGQSPADSSPQYPTVKIGGLLFLDYTYTQRPQGQDDNGRKIDRNSFNVGRAYVNVTGNLSRLISFRITPDIVREQGTGTSLNGSYVYRLKFAYGQFSFEDWAGKGSWIRLGTQPTPYITSVEEVYRYRFQGPIFVDREGYPVPAGGGPQQGFLVSSDAGFSGHYALPADYGDLHLGVYNGDGYNNLESNDQKSVQFRATLRPAPRVPILRGLRVTGFYDADHYNQGNRKQRFVANVTFENPHLNAGVEYLNARDEPSNLARDNHSRGWSVWATPRTSVGWEALFRYDELRRNTDLSEKKHRFIGGIAYWFPTTAGVQSALLLDYEDVTYRHDHPVKPRERRYALHSLFSF